MLFSFCKTFLLPDANSVHLAEIKTYANPNTSPSIRNKKNTLCPEWTMIPIQVLLKRLLGNEYKNTPLIILPNIPQG